MKTKLSILAQYFVSFRPKPAAGFTLVELLIVIVIIAILAAITIVAYNGITQRAYDSAMASDFATAAKKIRLFIVDNDRFPQTTTDAAAMGDKFSFSPVGQNVILCGSASDTTKFGIVARNPKNSSTWYAYDSQGGAVTKVTPVTASAANLCATTPYPALLWGAFWVQGG